MARPFYPSEVDDPDLDWLVSNFLIERPDYLPVETGSLPLLLIPLVTDKTAGFEEEIVFAPEDSEISHSPEENNPGE